MNDLMDRSKWPNGPWLEEPDKAYWRDKTTGYFCAIRRSPLGSLCGYVFLPKTHPAYLGTYDYIDVEVHGGLTYGQESGKFFKVGFDCAHFEDFVPGFAALSPEITRGCHYWNWQEVKLEVESLAQQLKEITDEN